MPGGARHVLAPVDPHVAALVRLRAHPPHGVEGDTGQGEHPREVLLQRLRRGPAVAARRGPAQPGAPVGEHRVQLGHRPDRRDGHEQVAPQEPHGVLHRALLVSGVRVAEPRLEAVVPPELREQPGLDHGPAQAPARLGGVVEDHHPRGAAPAAEDLPEPRAQALRRLRPQRDALPLVRVRQREDEELQVEGLAGDHGAEVAEVDLAGARRPLELEVALAAARRAGAPPVGDEAPHRRVGPLVAALADEPVVDPLGGVALLARRPQVRLEHGLDPRLVPGECGPRPRRGGRRDGRHVLHVGVLRHCVAAHAEPPRDLRPRHASGVHRPYIIHHVQGHGHLLRPSRAGSAKSPPGNTIRRGPRPWSQGARPSCSFCSILNDHGAQKAVTIRTTS